MGGPTAAPPSPHPHSVGHEARISFFFCFHQILMKLWTKGFSNVLKTKRKISYPYDPLPPHPPLAGQNFEIFVLIIIWWNSERQPAGGDSRIFFIICWWNSAIRCFSRVLNMNLKLNFPYDALPPIWWGSRNICFFFHIQMKFVIKGFLRVLNTNPKLVFPYDPSLSLR